MNECYAYRYNAVVWLIGRTMSGLELWACGQVHGGVHARDIVFAALEDDDGIVDYEALPQPHAPPAACSSGYISSRVQS